jgi:potassium-dependent mechanosensitive channel
VVSLMDLFAAAAIATVTVVGIQTVPGLLEVAVLKRMPLDNGMRYAIVAVTRHAIAIVGLVLAAGSMGIGWPKVQWLAAAITFGLGFGLQEIFANFVSGLIVLFERPIRVGDTVTVGDITGIVSRIRMRATTITDGDRKELIVPNKEFITAKLVNWTLSDSVTRLVVRLAIAYGSDTQLVQRLLLRVAAETPTVLRSPGAKAVFMGFSDKALEFELRVFVGSVEGLLPTRHQLNMGIESAFRTAGVDLAIPLREMAVPRVGPQLSREAA